MRDAAKRDAASRNRGSPTCTALAASSVMTDRRWQITLRSLALAGLVTLAPACNDVNDPDCAALGSPRESCCVPTAEVTSNGVQASDAGYTPTTHWTGATLSWRDGESPGTWVWKGGAWIWVGREGTILTCTGGEHVFVPRPAK